MNDEKLIAFVRAQPIRSLRLGRRVNSLFKKDGRIFTVGDLADCSAQELASIKGMGIKSLCNIIESLFLKTGFILTDRKIS